MNDALLKVTRPIVVQTESPATAIEDDVRGNWKSLSTFIIPGNGASSSPYEQMLNEIDPSLFIDVKQIAFDTQIGSGNFGDVYKAKYTKNNGITIKVACKTLHADARGVREFLQEGAF